MGLGRLWQPFHLLGLFAPDDVADVGWPSAAVNAGRKESRVDKIEVVRRECEWFVQVIDLFGFMLATVIRLSCEYVDELRWMTLESRVAT